MKRLLIKCREFYSFKHFEDSVFNTLKMHFWYIIKYKYMLLILLCKIFTNFLSFFTCPPGSLQKSRFLSFPHHHFSSFHHSLTACVWLLLSPLSAFHLMRSLDIPHSEPWRRGVRDPPHLFGSRHGPHSVWCGVPFRWTVRHGPP